MAMELQTYPGLIKSLVAVVSAEWMKSIPLVLIQMMPTGQDDILVAGNQMHLLVNQPTQSSFALQRCIA